MNTIYLDFVLELSLITFFITSVMALGYANISAYKHNLPIYIKIALGTLTLMTLAVLSLFGL